MLSKRLAAAGNFATFLMGMDVIASISFAEPLPGGLFDQGAVFGNNTLNRIAPISGPSSFDTVVITLGGSGAVDNLVFDMPAPGALGLFALGLGLVGVSRCLIKMAGEPRLRRR